MKIKLTESQLNKVVKNLIYEQGLYGNTSDVVDYDLPEFLSDTIILQTINEWSDVEKSLKELHKRYEWIRDYKVEGHITKLTQQVPTIQPKTKKIKI
jgi:hypothetical protein